MLFDFIPKVEETKLNLAKEYQEKLTKPPKSLGLIENVACRLSAIQDTLHPKISSRSIVLVAGDHGVCEENISAYPSEVSLQMMENFINGGAAINVLSRQFQAPLLLVDAGLERKKELPSYVLQVGLGKATKNIRKTRAMEKTRAEELLREGQSLAFQLKAKGQTLIALGEMGIGNTTPASALTAIFTKKEVEEVTGSGTGIGIEQRKRKIEVIKDAIQCNQEHCQDPIGTLSALGGFEIAFLCGLILGLAQSKVAILLDGFISTSAALCAQAIQPEVTSYLFTSHLSREKGHKHALEKLSLEPLLQLDMALGEASGAAMALPLFDASIALHNEMATFEDASVSNKKKNL